MNNYVAIVFSSEQKAHDGLRALWHLDDEAKITVHGASIVRRDTGGHIKISNRHSDFGRDTAIGVGIGALLGLLAGPIGIAAGIAGAAAISASAVGISAATGIGALAGGAIGVTADAVNAGERDYATYDAFFILKDGEFAVLAEVSEHWVEVINDTMVDLSGAVYRRSKSDITNATFGPNYYGYYLHPYYYAPPYYY
ncbi:hypothetical protein [Psychrobacter alimentarius]|uniref:hypothetical protein n=1 Tax=Psychrobacter alimentarius TaxID=261164 RepID=UPI0019194051|nr:hypothetical protein [Psychrobacter alimentarius]